MAIYHLSFKLCKRSDGKSSVYLAAYQNRNKIKDFVTGSALNGTDVTASKMTYDWNENSRLTYNGLANYNWSNENHNISALGGVSYEHYKYQQQVITQLKKQLLLSLLRQFYLY